MMSSSRRRSHVLPAVLVAVLLASTVTIPTIAQEDVVCVRGWFDVQLSEDIAPEGVIAFTPDEPWIAGGTLFGGGRRAAAVLHGRGDDAVLEQPPLPEMRDSGLMAIGAAGPDEPLWAVGFGRETDFVAAYVARRDDDGWGRTETIRPDGFSAALTDIDADIDAGVWAAGFLQGEPGDQRPWVLELREDGRTGHRLPLDDGERATLAGISADDEGGVWAVGTALADASMTPYIARHEGGAWDRFVLDGAADAAIADVDVPARQFQQTPVEEDFRESGRRAILNFGHTIGHAVEYVSGLPHGFAVSVGMVAAGVISNAAAPPASCDPV